MEKNKNKQKSDNRVDEQNERQQTSGSRGKNISYQDIPGIKKTSDQQSENSRSSNQSEISERKR